MLHNNQVLNRSGRPLNANLNLSILDAEPQPLTFMSDVRRTTSIALALEKKKISLSGKTGQDPTGFLSQLPECGDSLEITEDEILNNMTLVLSGEAFKWFRLKYTNFTNFAHYATVFKK